MIERPAPGSIPDAAGAYLFRDPEGRVIYVGKAKSLRKRLASYWSSALHPRTSNMVHAATSVEWIVTGSEVDALLLEWNLIREHRPRFNIRFRDDKSYPYLAVTTADRWPRAHVVRGSRRRGVRYFGPYPHAYAIRETLDALGKVFPVRTCTDAYLEQRARARRPCLAYDIGRCAGPCVPDVTGVTEEAYRSHVEGLEQFLAGATKPVLSRLQREMAEAAGSLEFERAARLRDALGAARRISEAQEVVLPNEADLDAVAVVGDDLEACAQVFFVRDGRVVGRKGWVADRVEDIDDAGLLASFLRMVYLERDAAEIPPTVVLDRRVPEADVLEAWLAARRGRRVAIESPSRGPKRRLVELVGENADEHFSRHKLRRASDFAARSRALAELAEALALPQPPLRIECYDISNLGPTDVVGSMVVFEDGMPRRSDYRRFAIRGVQGQDDFASMREVLGRRLARLDEQREGSRRFAYRPSLIVIDGGRGQLSAAVSALHEVGADIPVIGLAKRLEEVFLPDADEPLMLPRGSEALFVLQQIRDEAHRFALAYHRSKRGRRALISPLESIPGVGPARRKALLAAFGSVASIASAAEEDVARVAGIGPTLARAILDNLRSGPDGDRRETA